jgi:hypothetical protein
MTSFAIETNVSWPFIDVPHFETRGTEFNDFSGALQIAYAPLVTNENRKKWEDFAFEHQEWIIEATEFHPEQVSHYVPEISKHIFRLTDGDDGEAVIQESSAMSDSEMSGSEMSGSEMSGSEMSGSEMSGSAMSGSAMSGSEMSDSAMSDSEMSDSEMSDSAMSGSAMSGSEMSDSEMSDSAMSDSAMSGSAMSGSAMSGSAMSGSAMSGPGDYAPIWQQAPAPHDPSIINFDLLSHSVFNRVYHVMLKTGLPAMSEATKLDWFYGGAIQDETDHPHSFLLQPIYPYISKDSTYHGMDIVGFVVGILPWDTFLSNILHEGANGIVIVMHDTCGDTFFTYQLNGPEAIYLGEGDLHDRQYDHLRVQNTFAPFLLDTNASATNDHRHANAAAANDQCFYHLRIFPSEMLEEEYRTWKPAVYSTVVVLVFFLTAIVFVVYDYMVSIRHDKVMATAKRTNKIVSSFFPSNIRDRILKDAEEEAENEIKQKWRGIAPKAKLKTFLSEQVGGMDGHGNQETKSKPIADLFPHVTVMFGDIVGFTSWSSVREPCQVFTLLETIFAAFDDIARKRRVFKVETVGDCYVSNDQSVSIRSLVWLCFQAGFRVKSIDSMCGTFERASVLNQYCFSLFSHVIRLRLLAYLTFALTMLFLWLVSLKTVSTR